MENQLVENSTFTATCENQSQYCCAMSYLHWIVISIACSSILDFFKCLERKNIKQNRRKMGRKPPNLDRF